MGHYCKAHMNDALYCYICSDIYTNKFVKDLEQVARMAQVVVERDKEQYDRLIVVLALEEALKEIPTWVFEEDEE